MIIARIAGSGASVARLLRLSTSCAWSVEMTPMNITYEPQSIGSPGGPAHDTRSGAIDTEDCSCIEQIGVDAVLHIYVGVKKILSYMLQRKTAISESTHPRCTH